MSQKFKLPENSMPEEVTYESASELPPGIALFILYVCAHLELEPPYLAVTEQLFFVSGETLDAALFMPEDSQTGELDKPLILASTTESFIHFAGLLASQLRRIWQRKYHSDEFSPFPGTAIKKLYYPCAIDMDAFAIACMQALEGEHDLEHYGEILCPGMAEHDGLFFRMRVDRAKTFRI